MVSNKLLKSRKYGILMVPIHILFSACVMSFRLNFPSESLLKAFDTNIKTTLLLSFAIIYYNNNSVSTHTQHNSFDRLPAWEKVNKCLKLGFYFEDKT